LYLRTKFVGKDFTLPVLATKPKAMFEFGLIAGTNGDRCPVPGEFAGENQAEAARGAGNQYNW